MIEDVLPPGVSFSDTRGEFPETSLFSEEKRAICDSVERRRREYTTTRVCAHRALADLGVGSGPVLSGPRGEPLWPHGVVGSLTHCEGYRAAAVGHARLWLGLGVDAEPHDPLPPGVMEAVTLAEERVRLRNLRESEPGVHWDRLLFSAKESVYKAWYPLTAQRLGFEDVSVRISPRTSTFSAWVAVSAAAAGSPAPNTLAGEWNVRDGLVLTGVALRRSERPKSP